jgi:phosphoribosylamine--glycine ligase
LPRLKSDLIEIMLAASEQKLNRVRTLEWETKACVCVVCASGGYPGDYEKGKEIFGLDEATKMKDTVVFHAGTKELTDLRTKERKIVTNGGRVLDVTGLGDTIKEAIDKTYQAVDKIHFEGMHYRRDIGRKAIS